MEFPCSVGVLNEAGALPKPFVEEVTGPGDFDFGVYRLPPDAASAAGLTLEAAQRDCTLLSHAQCATCFVPLLDAEATAGPGLGAALSWAAHLGVPVAVVTLPSSCRVCAASDLASATRLPVPPGADAAHPSGLTAAQLGSIARELLVALQPPPGGAPPLHVWVLVQACCGWEPWRRLKDLLGGAPSSVSVALALPLWSPQCIDAPPALRLRQWLGEPLKSVFVAPDAGALASLAPRCAWFLAALVARRLQFVTSPAQRAAPRAAFADAMARLARCDWALDACPFRLPEGARDWACAAGLLPGQASAVAFNDVLQAPLQPLAHHLSAGTYEVFERDDIKYVTYENAIHDAVRDWLGARAAAVPHTAEVGEAAASPPPAKRPRPSAASPTPTLRIMVAGAGRGPILAAAIRAVARVKEAAAASDSAPLPSVAYIALEKNPAALLALRRRAATEWAGLDVTVVAQDMRCGPPVPCDLLVSELLGSFGGNEGNDACMAPAIALHLAPGGIAIPAAWQAWVEPVTSSVLWGAVRAFAEGAPAPGPGPDKWWETPFVVRPAAAFYPAAGGPQLCLAGGTSPAAAAGAPPAHEGQCFSVEADTVIHGLMGYFEAQLYTSHVLSTVPGRHTPGMLSWFPLLFPLKAPLVAGAGARVRAWVQERFAHAPLPGTPGSTAPARQWYEWAAQVEERCGGDEEARVLATSQLHNAGGRSACVTLLG